MIRTLTCILLLLAIPLVGCGGGDGNPCSSICGSIDDCGGSSGSCRDECGLAYRNGSDACAAAIESWADCSDSHACADLGECNPQCLSVESACGVDPNCM